jgi:hypothetical protein
VILPDLSDECCILSKQKQHLQAIIKVRNERDLLEEQEKVLCADKWWCHVGCGMWNSRSECDGVAGRLEGGGESSAG